MIQILQTSVWKNLKLAPTKQTSVNFHNLAELLYLRSKKRITLKLAILLISRQSFQWYRRFSLTGAYQKLNKQREGLLWRSRRLFSTKAEGRGGFTTVSLLHNFATFEFVWVSSYGCAEAHVHIRLAAYWQSPKLAPLEGARNTLKDFFSKATKGIFSVAYIKYYVVSLLRTKT